MLVLPTSLMQSCCGVSLSVNCLQSPAGSHGMSVFLYPTSVLLLSLGSQPCELEVEAWLGLRRGVLLLPFGKHHCSHFFRQEEFIYFYFYSPSPPSKLKGLEEGKKYEHVFGLTEMLCEFVQLNCPTSLRKEGSSGLLLGSIKKMETSHIYICEIKPLLFFFIKSVSLNLTSVSYYENLKDSCNSRGMLLRITSPETTGIWATVRKAAFVGLSLAFCFAQVRGFSSFI